MNSRRSVVRVAGWGAAGVLAAGAIGVGIAQAADPAPSPSGSSSASASPEPPDNSASPGGHGRLGGRRHVFPYGKQGVAGRAMHGELVVRGKDGNPVTVALQNGSVTAVSASSVTVKSEDGFTATYRITSDTKVRIATKGATAAEIKTGDKAAVSARVAGGDTTAQLVAVHE